MDDFHFSQALGNLTTQKYDDVYNALYEYVLDNKKKDFIRLCNEFMDLFPERKDIIESKRDYILNNWTERQFYQNHSYLKCSMESHLSHIFADIFTSRPKSYSKKGLRQLLKLRLLKVNNKDIKNIYFNNLRNNEIDFENFFISTIILTLYKIKKENQIYYKFNFLNYLPKTLYTNVIILFINYLCIILSVIIFSFI